MIEVTNKVQVYEVDGKETKIGQKAEPLLVLSHWNSDDWVVIQVGDKKVTVNADDLITAVNNSTHTSRY